MNEPDEPLEPAIRSLLEQRGPLSERRLQRLLAEAGRPVGDVALQAAILAAGATRVAGPSGPLLAVSVDDDRAAEATATRSAAPDDRVRTMLARTRPEVLIVVVAVLAIVIVIIVASVNAGLRVAPTLHYSPPATAGSGGG